MRTLKPPLSRTFKLTLLASLVLPTLVLDQWSKILAIQYLKYSPAKSFFNGMAKLIYAENPGAWGSLGAHWPESLRFAFLIVIPLLVLLGIIIYIFLSHSMAKREALALGLIVAGGLGNLIDRIRFGYVVDMFWVGIPQTWWQTNIFNIADMIIMLAFGLLLMNTLQDWKKKKS